MLESQDKGMIIAVIRKCQVFKKAEEKYDCDEERNRRYKKDPNQTSRDEKHSFSDENILNGKRTYNTWNKKKLVHLKT